MDKDILIYMNKKIIATLLILIVFTIHSLLVKTMMNMESNHDCPLSILMTGECLADSTPIEVLSFHDHLIFTVQTGNIVFLIIFLIIVAWFYSKNDFLKYLFKSKVFYIHKWQFIYFLYYQKIRDWSSYFFRIPKLSSIGRLNLLYKFI